MADAASWWAQARKRAKGGGPLQWAHVLEWFKLDRNDRRRIERQVKLGLRSDDPEVQHFARRIVGDIVVAEFATEESSDHIRLEIAATRWRGRPFEAGEPVPGSCCAGCTPDRAREPEPPAERSTPARKPLDIDAARAVPIHEIVARLGFAVKGNLCKCPFHDDAHPSMHLGTKKNVAHCHACGETFDGIALVRELRGCDFRTAVEWITS